MEQNNIVLQGGFSLLDKASNSQYSMMVGFCEDLVNVTKRTDCEPTASFLGNLKYLAIEVKLLTRFFDSSTYSENNNTMEQTFLTQILTLNEKYF